MLDAYHLAAIEDRNTLRALAEDRSRAPADRALLRAVVRQYDGDVDGAVRILRQEMKGLSGSAFAAAADTLAPILVMRHENDEVLAVAGQLEDAGWCAAAQAFRALAAADAGDRHAARKHLDAADDALEFEADDVVRFRVLQRMARAAYYLDEHERALDLALSSARLSSQRGAWRAAAGAYSIAYSVHHSVTGDVREADRFAQLGRDAAARGADESFLQMALVAEHELAVQFADDERAQRLEADIRGRLLPEQYRERFVLALSMAIARGWVDLDAMRTMLAVLRTTEGCSAGQWSSCTALIALAEAAAADDAAARVSVREAVARLGRPATRVAYERRDRRLARAVASAACVLLGDDVRAERIVAARESREGDGEDRLPEMMRTGTLDRAPLALRGIARVLEAAFAKRHGLEPPAGLTDAEYEVLRLFGRGWSAGKIAAETGRSVNTVYKHTRVIHSKLDASSTPEAVAKARERGFLT